MKIVDRYLLRELVGACVGTAFLLLIITLGGTMSDVLRRVANGEVPLPLLLSQVGLRSLDVLALLLPLAVFVAVLLAYGRLYRDSEMAILASAGMSSRALLRPILLLALPLLVAVAMLAFWIVPGALRIADRMVDQANRSLLTAGLEAGRFMPLPGGAGVVYVGAIEQGGTRFRRLFVYREREDRVDIVTATQGKLFHDQDGSHRFLALQDGFRVEGSLASPNFRTMRFERNELALPESEKVKRNRAETRVPSRELLASSRPRDRAELHWRLGLPLSVLTLALLAFPLARGGPRDPRYGKLLIAVLAYIVYLNLLALGRGWIGDGSMPAWLGLWWVHAIALGLAAWMIASADRVSKRQAPRPLTRSRA
ncbi:MAG: LPS export ABC transporter permease LptF [Lysobacterales bacterium]